MDQAKPFGPTFGLEEVQDLQQLQLIMEVMFQPDRDSIKHCVGFDDGISHQEICAGLSQWNIETFAQISGPDFGKRPKAGGGDQRSLVKNVAPRNYSAARASGGENIGGSVAIGDDQFGHCLALGIAIMHRAGSSPLPK